MSDDRITVSFLGETCAATGPAGSSLLRAARDAGAPEVVEVDDALQAIEILPNLLRPHDVLLVKGSRAMELDRVIGALRAGSAPQDG